MNETDPLHPGDICLVVDDVDGYFPENVGQECVVLEEERLHACRRGRPGAFRSPVPKLVHGYQARLESGRVMVFERRELKKRRPPAPEMQRIREVVQDAERGITIPVQYGAPKVFGKVYWPASSFNGRTAACRAADRGLIPREIAK